MAFLAITLAAGCTSDTPEISPDSFRIAGPDSSDQDFFASQIISGGTARDSIPAIDTPLFITVEEADQFVDNTDIVFLIE
ncbi:MAG: hypothetical protein JXA44_12850 [Methanospirillaceae archaeon]|nr:hypothetical protein [Methanospirillaceae archaeon]